MHSDVGQVRSENQDSHGYTRTKRSRLYVVADGMGGSGGGATASTMAVNIITRTSVQKDGYITEASLVGAVHATHEAIYEASKSDESLTRMGTTVVALALTDDKAMIAHVGDSRLYLWRDTQICQLTRDHTLVQELVDSGTISPTDAENHPMAHYLTRSLSPESKARAEVHTYPYPVQLGDKFLLCCDGLYNLVTDEDIAQILATTPTEDAARTLVNLANERGGTDNITVQLVDVYALLEDGEEDEPLEYGEYEILVSTDYEAGTLNETAQNIVEAVISKHFLANGASSLETMLGATSEDTDAAPLNVLASGPARTDSGPRDYIRPDAPPLENEGVSSVEYATNGIGSIIGPAGASPSVEREKQIQKTEEPAKGLPRNITLLIAGLLTLVIVFGTITGYLLFRPQPAPIPAPLPMRPAPVVSTESPGVATPGEEPATEIPPSDFNGQPEVPTTPRTVEQDLAALGGISQELTPITEVAPEEVKPEDAAEMAVAAKVISEASDLSLPPPPDGGLQGSSTKPDEPIDWKAEKEFKDEVTPPVAAQTSAPAPEESESTKVLLDDELKSLISQKQSLRDKISDIDTKIRMYRLSTKKDAAGQISELEKQLAEIDPALKLARTNVETAERRLELWLMRQKAIDSKGKDSILKLAEEVSTGSVQVKRKKESHDIASMRYADAVELWTENPNDGAAASRMTMFGRELRTRRANLEESIMSAVREGTSQSRFDISDWGIAVEDLERRKERLNRHIGFFKGFTAPVQSEQKRMEQQRTLFNERTKLSEEFEQLREKVSDETEIQFRRKALLSDIDVTKTQ